MTIFTNDRFSSVEESSVEHQQALLGREVIDYSRSVYPYCDFCLTYAGNSEKALEAPIAGFDIHTLPTHGHRLYLDKSSRTARSGDRVLWFSGVARGNSKMLYGQQDLTANDLADTKKLEYCVGSYTLGVADAQKVHLSTDYFGVSKLFYYQDDGSYLISNRIHLLLLILRASGRSARINADRVIADLAFHNQVYQQAFTQELSVAGLNMSRTDESIVCLGPRGMNFVASEIGQILHQPPKYSPNEYRDLVDESAREILENTAIALEHPRFDRVVVDLTGGLDSRMVYSAVTRFPDFYGKVAVSTNPSSREPGFDQALAINALYKFPYYRAEMPAPPASPAQMKLRSISHSLDLYHVIPRQVSVRSSTKTLRLSGFYGEICARPYFSRNWLLRRDRSDTFDWFFEKHIALQQHYGVPGCPESVDRLRDIMRGEFSRLPGRTPLEQFDLHYLFFRNGLHCSSYVHRPPAAHAEWGVLQSKTMFYAKMATFHEFEGIRLQLDVSAALNPFVSLLPYALAKNNEDYSRTQLLIPVPESCPVLPSVDEIEGMRRLAEASRKPLRTERTDVSPDRAELSLERDAAQSFDDYVQSGFSTIRDSEALRGFDPLIGRIYQFSLEGPATARMVALNKIVSLGQIIRLTETG